MNLSITLPPPIPEDLVKWLDTVFPERTPDPEWSLDHIRIETGKRAVVRYLRRIYEEQNEGGVLPSTIETSHHVQAQDP